MATVKTHYLKVKNLADLEVKLPLLLHQIKQEQDNERLFNEYAKAYEADLIKKQREKAPKVVYQNGKYYVVDRDKYYLFELYPWYTVSDHKLFLFNGKLISSIKIQAIIAERTPIDTSNGINSQLENTRNKLAGTKNLYHKIKNLRLQFASQKSIDYLDASGDYEGDNKFADAFKRLEAISDNSVNTLTNQINELLITYDFESIEEYNAATSGFLRLIKSKAHKFVDKHLYTYEQFLKVEEKKLEDPSYLQNVYDKLMGSGAKKNYKKAKDARKHSTYFDKYEQKAKSKLLLEAYDSKIAGKEAIQCLDLPLTKAPNFDYAGFAKVNSPEEIKMFLKEHIKEQRDNFRKSRDYILEGDTVFEFPEIISQVLQLEGIYEGTVLYSMVMDKISTEAFNRAGTAALIGAGAVAGIGMCITVEEVKDYNGQSAMHAIGLTEKAPSILWVIISAIGSALDLAALKNISKALLTASKTFETSKKTIGLEKALSQLDTDLSKLVGITEVMRKNIIKQARLDDSYKNLLKVNSLQSIVSLEQLAIRGARIAYYIIRKGIVNFDQFLLELKARKIVDNITSLSPEKIKILKETFNKVKNELKIHPEKAEKDLVEALFGIKRLRRQVTIVNPSDLGKANKVMLKNENDEIIGYITRNAKYGGPKGGITYQFTSTEKIGELSEGAKYDLECTAKLLDSESAKIYDLTVRPNEEILYLDFNIPSKINNEYAGLGKIIFDDAHTVMENSKRVPNVDGMFGVWVKNEAYYVHYGGESLNLKKFWKAYNGGKSTTEAAFKTITGQWAKANGYTKAEIQGEILQDEVIIKFLKE